MQDDTIYGIRLADLETGIYDLNIHETRNVVVYPCSQANIVRGSPAGVLHRDGSEVPDTALIRTVGRITTMPRPIAGWRQKRYAGDAIFGGYMIDQYGHFLLESLTRLWFAAETSLPIVWASGVRLNAYQREILVRLGIHPDRMLFLKRPTRFRRLIIPRPGYIIQKGFHERHARFLSCGQAYEKSGANVYLSRRVFQSQIATFDGERELEDMLRKEGWNILRPEALSIEQQIEVFSSSRCVAGVEGSAFHTAILCARLHGGLALVRRPQPNANYDTIARLKNFRQQSITGHIVQKAQDPRLFDVVDPARLAEKIMMQADRIAG